MGWIPIFRPQFLLIYTVNMDYFVMDFWILIVRLLKIDNFWNENQ